jgi:hypothetical protein
MKTLIRGSSLPRFTVCNGSMALETPEQPDGEYAMVGTAFHSFLESRFMGTTPALVGAYHENGTMYDEDMDYFSYKILPMIPSHATAELEVEYPISNTTIKGHVDYNWEEDEGRTLVVMDIKYGHRAVEVDNNWQLIGYGLGIMIRNQKSYDKIILRVIQPRAHHFAGMVRDVVLTQDQMTAYYNQLTGQTKFVTSEHCRYCPALGQECPAMNRAYFNAIDVVIDVNVQDSIDDEGLSYMLKMYDRIKDVFKIKHEALSELAKTRIKSGKIISGFGLEPNFTNRKWIAGLTIDSVKTMAGFDLSDVSMMSPAQAEKKKFDQGVIDSLSYKEQKGFNLKQMDASKYADAMFGKEAPKKLTETGDK